MSSFKAWILANGDHFLNEVSILLLGGTATGLLPPGWKWTPILTVALGMLHTIVVPQQPAPAPKVPA